MGWGVALVLRCRPAPRQAELRHGAACTKAFCSCFVVDTIQPNSIVQRPSQRARMPGARNACFRQRGTL